MQGTYTGSTKPLAWLCLWCRAPSRRRILAPEPMQLYLRRFRGLSVSTTSQCLICKKQKYIAFFLFFIAVVDVAFRLGSLGDLYSLFRLRRTRVWNSRLFMVLLEGSFGGGSSGRLKNAFRLSRVSSVGSCCSRPFPQPTEQPDSAP